MQRRWSVLMMGLVLGVCCARSALATPPTDWDIAYGIHETPSAPESPLLFTIKLSLTRIHVVGNSIGWGIAAVEIRQIGQDGSTTARWAKVGPSVSTADGLWWINHANANSPQPAEFVRPPHLEGLAENEDPNDTDLIYDFQGEFYTAPPAPASPPYAITASLDYSFTLVDAPEPLLDQAGEPVEGDPTTGD